jgi:uncharacterized protein
VKILYKLYTHNDLDGVGCGIVAKLAFGDKVDVRYNSVMGLDTQVERLFEHEKKLSEFHLFITDLSINEENTKRVESLHQSGGKVNFIDHHKTALHFNDYSWGSVKVEYEDGRLTSATSLLYEHLLGNKWIQPSKSVDQFVELIRQYDTWEWDQNDNVKAKQLNDLFFMFAIDEFEEKMLDRLTQHQEGFEFDEFEQKLLSMEEDKIERYVRRKKRETFQTFIDDYCAGIVHAESYHSELGNELGKGYPHLDYIAILNVGGKKISFRTIHDHVDVSAVAGQFGGGGHAKASGCSMGKEAFELYVQDVYPLDPIKQDAFRNRYNLKESPKGSLYDTRQGERFFIFPVQDEQWGIEGRNGAIDVTFHEYQEAENYLKRNFGASLSRDDVYVKYLIDFYLKQKD